MVDHRHWSLGTMLVSVLVACAPRSTGAGDESDAETSTTASEETGESSSSETTGSTCGLLGDACSASECCGDLVCSGAPPVCDVDTDESTSGFIPSPGIDGVPGCEPGLQNCPEGEKCTAYVMTPGYCCVDANKCVEIIGDKQLGDVCTREEDSDDCDKGLFCMTKTSGDTGEGVCLVFCDINDPASCAVAGLPDAKCIAYNDGVLPLCEDDCDPLVQDCTPPQGCYAIGSQGFVCTLPGHEDGKGNDGDACDTIQSCQPGLLCAAGDAQNGCMAARCCTPFCDASGDGSECTDGMETCVPYYEMGMAPPGYEDVGACSLP